MFIIREEIEETIEWPVKVKVPVDGGDVRHYSFTGIFKRLGKEQKKSLLENIELAVENDPDQAHTTEADKTFEKNVKFAFSAMVGWKGVVNPQKEVVLYTLENLRKALNSPSGTAIYNAIFQTLVQIENGASAKN